MAPHLFKIGMESTSSFSFVGFLVPVCLRRSYNAHLGMARVNTLKEVKWKRKATLKRGEKKLTEIKLEFIDIVRRCISPEPPL